MDGLSIIILIIIVFISATHIGKVIRKKPPTHRPTDTYKSTNSSTYQNQFDHFDKEDWHLFHLKNVRLKWQPVLTGREADVLRLVENYLNSREPGKFRVLAQVNMGEFVKIDSPYLSDEKYKKVGKAYNSKRIDILVVDYHFWPRVAIEYQGKDHDQGNAAKRDEIKRNVLAKADITFIEILHKDSNEMIESKIKVWLDAWLSTQQRKLQS